MEIAILLMNIIAEEQRNLEGRETLKGAPAWFTSSPQPFPSASFGSYPRENLPVISE